MRRTIVLLATMALTVLVASGVALATAIGSAQAANKVVGPGESIQKAINAAHPGDTIIVRGVHKEDVVIARTASSCAERTPLSKLPPEPKQTRHAPKFSDWRASASSATLTSKPASSPGSA
jgi:hypothetical protein